MKALTANRLIDGEVVWLGRTGWVETLDLARVLETAEAEGEATAIGAAAIVAREVVDPYLIDLRRDADGALEPVRFRERIRANGPTSRRDLGKQARRETSAA